MKVKKAVLVYQAGFANVFSVKSFKNYGSGAVRIFQSDFHSSEMLCRGLDWAGATVRVAYCNEAGDIINSHWLTDLDNAPFNNSFGYSKTWRPNG